LKINPDLRILIAIGLGALAGYWNNALVNQTAVLISDIFLNLLTLISTPIIFFSIVSTVSGMRDAAEFNIVGKKLLKYTLLTTYIAAAIALVLYIAIDPAQHFTNNSIEEAIQFDKGYLAYFIKIIPSNFITPFSENQVISALFLAILLSFAVLQLPKANRDTLHQLFLSLNSLMLKIAAWLVAVMPLAIWAFITLLFRNIEEGLSLSTIGWYLVVVVAANAVQAFIVLPIFAKTKGIAPLSFAKQMMPALMLAFFSKSSSATLPLTMQCAENRAKIPKKLSSLAFPLCTAINMNGCAAFILITVLFVATTHGMHFSYVEMIGWTFFATLAAFGNAGVPMGCYFLSSAFLAAMNVPLTTLAVILPFYAVLDMLETALNVWSDACVVAVVGTEIKEEL